MIANFNSTSQDFKIEIDKSKIKEHDTLTVIYRDDTPCDNCKFVLFAKDEKNRKLNITKTEEFLGKLSFELKNLVVFGDNNESERYDFYYWEQTGESNKTQMTLVLITNFDSGKKKALQKQPQAICKSLVLQ